MVASGKGGTGKSTLSVYLGARLAAQGKRVLLVELDSGLRSVDIIAGVCGRRYTTSRIFFPADAIRTRRWWKVLFSPAYRLSAPHTAAVRFGRSAAGTG